MRTVPARPGPEQALPAARDGTGAAVLPLPDGAGGEWPRAAPRPDEPVEDHVAVLLRESR